MFSFDSARLCVLAVTLLACGCERKKSELAQTLEWMDNTYNEHRNVSGASGHGSMRWFTPVMGHRGEEQLAGRTDESFTFSGQVLVVKREGSPVYPPDIIYESIYRFDLKDIDPSSLTTRTYSHIGNFSCEPDANGEKSMMAENCDHAEIVFKTRNEAGLINEDRRTTYLKLTGSDHENRSSDKTNYAYFVFDDPEYSKRFAKAFARAIELSGGKASLF